MKTALVLLSLALITSVFARDVYESLQAGGKTYTQVMVLSANESSLSIKHSRGISQIALADLAPELQSKYGYRASADAARNRKLEQMRRVQTAEANERLQAKVKIAQSRSRAQAATASPSVRSAFARFGVDPHLSSELDLRPSFRGHGISIRKQRGPSCSVHAIAAALEYQFAEEKGKKINVSERYLVEATSKTLGRQTRNDMDAVSGGSGAVEEGFSLEQVFQAIRGHGLALEVPNEKGYPQTSLPKEFENINFSPFQIPGAKTEAGVGNLIHVLNAKMPVVVGVGWPNGMRVRNTSVLSKQPPADGIGHAVTIVGYRCPTGKIEDTKFIFRNSWGPRWGAGGYGFFTYEYLLKNLWSSYVVELR
ncbi:C1 family peptidase [Pelagicoccus mobilis]|uniref:Peptidase C1A papain C-terminal domain-containing protein n=1 Tax=Pelagicoccus mobilis TaxID=415221 RepID=A0A934RYW8_9BACT|nr:C1 family peptidase [Pelagicoccus mobilis]MBK1880255.1 hypothetical protein [Pelagicoccus mobilis]